MAKVDPKDLAENRRGRFDYEMIETYEAGIELFGPEVKSVKNGHMQINGSYAVIRNGEAWLLNSKVPPYQPKNIGNDYPADRTRRLLLHSEEIKSLTGKLNEKNYSLIPLKVYSKHGLIKLELGLGRSRKKSDKREVVKKRETAREMRRARLE